MVKKKGTVKAKQAESIKEESSKKIPVGVQVISVFYYICACFCVLVGLLILIFAGAIVSLLTADNPEFVGVITAGVIAGLGILLALLGVLTFFVGRGLWKLKPWARILAIILGIVAGIYAIYGMIKAFGFMQIINLAISAAIAIYLIVNKEVKRAFK
jgi:lysylphosphatidylglycerol synthetase-like protein (DUF2156 family)